MDFPLSLMAFLSSLLGFLIGGMVAWGFKYMLKGNVAIIFSFCAGVISGIVLIDIIPETIRMGGWVTTILGLIVGSITFLWVEYSAKSVTIITAYSKKDQYLKTAALLIISMVIHNVPAGFTIGATREPDLHQSLNMALFFHTIPEGIAVSTPILMSGYGIYSIVAISVIVSLPIAISVYLGVLMKYISLQSLSFIIGFTIGLILTVTWKEILGKAIQDSNILYCSVFFCLGFLVTPVYINIVSAFV